MKKKLFATLLAAGTALTLAACSGGGDPLATEGNGDSDSNGETESIIVGSADFAESQLLATIYAQALENAGYDVQETPNIGGREVYLTAIQDGSIDLIPEYNGYLLQELDADAEVTDRDDIQEQLFEMLPDGITVLDFATAENTNTLVVKPEFAKEHGGLETISDLAEADDGKFTMAGPSEWRTRPKTGLPGIKDTYGMDFFDRYQVLDAGGPLSLTAIVNDQVDISMLFSSDPAIGENDLVALEDDKVIFPPANIQPMINEDKATPEVTELLNELTSKLNIEDLQEMNSQVNDGVDFNKIASDWLEKVGLA